MRRMGPSKFVATIDSAAATSSHRRPEILDPHDARVIDEHVQRRVARLQFGSHGADTCRVFDVDRERSHARVRGGGRIERLLAAAGDDDLVPQAWNASASPRPMPDPPPVIRMVLPVSFMLGS